MAICPPPRRPLPAHQEQLLLRGLWAVLLPDVDGEEGGAAVEDGGQRRHQGGHHHRDHESTQTCVAQTETSTHNANKNTLKGRF